MLVWMIKGDEMDIWVHESWNTSIKSISSSLNQIAKEMTVLSSTEEAR